MKNLSLEEIKQMRGELDIDRYKAKIRPARGYWDVYRIVVTLESNVDRITALETRLEKQAIELRQAREARDNAEDEVVKLLGKLAESVPKSGLTDICYKNDFDDMCIHSVECLAGGLDMEKTCPLLEKP